MWVYIQSVYVYMYIYIYTVYIYIYIINYVNVKCPLKCCCKRLCIGYVNVTFVSGFYCIYTGGSSNGVFLL